LRLSSTILEVVPSDGFNLLKIAPISCFGQKRIKGNILIDLKPALFNKWSNDFGVKPCKCSKGAMECTETPSNVHKSHILVPSWLRKILGTVIRMIVLSIQSLEIFFKI
jgi:hypothetical protein